MIWVLKDGILNDSWGDIETKTRTNPRCHDCGASLKVREVLRGGIIRLLRSRQPLAATVVGRTTIPPPA